MTHICVAQDPNFFIFLCFGQSNMEGQGTIESQDRTVDDRFQVYQAVNCSNLEKTKGIWYPAIPPLCRCWSGLSPADYFGRTLVENLPEHIKIGVINVSVGGCRIELFDKDIYEKYTNTYSDDWFQNIIKEYEGNPYQYLLDLAKSAQQDGVIKGILLHQGESNNQDSQWPNKVNKIYTDLISDLNLNAEEIPLLAGELVHEDQGGSLAGMNSIINQLPDVLPNSYIISSSDCEDKSDNIHFNAAGYRELGKRYGEKMLSLLEYNPDLVLSSVNRIVQVNLSQNYPNPARNRTSISFEIPESAHVTISLHNVLGQQQNLLIDRTYMAGRYEIETDLTSFQKGIYFYRLKVNSEIITRRMIVQ